MTTRNIQNRITPPPEPIPLSPSERMPGTAPGDLDDAGRCWLWSAPADSLGIPAQWRLLRPMRSAYWDRWLPASVKHLPTEVECWQVVADSRIRTTSPLPAQRTADHT